MWCRLQLCRLASSHDFDSCCYNNKGVNLGELVRMLSALIIPLQFEIKKKRTSNRPLPSKIVNWKNYQHSQRIAIICVTLIYTHWKSCQFYGVCGFYWDSLYVIPGHLWSICMKWKWSLTQSETRLHQNNLLFMKILTLLIVLAAVLFHYIPCWYGYTKCLSWLLFAYNIFNELDFVTFNSLHLATLNALLCLFMLCICSSQFLTSLLWFCFLHFG